MIQMQRWHITMPALPGLAPLVADWVETWAKLDACTADNIRATQAAHLRVNEHVGFDVVHFTFWARARA